MNLGEYTIPDINIDNLYQEEFNTNTFSDDSASESSSTDNKDSIKYKIKLSDTYKRIYNTVTLFI